MLNSLFPPKNTNNPKKVTKQTEGRARYNRVTMRILLALAAVLLFAACGSSGEDVPTDAPTATASPATSGEPGGDVVICAHVGDGSTPTTPTPVPSCQPSTGETLQLSPDVFGQVTDPPPLPAGKTAASDYVVIYGDASATIGIPLKSGVPAGASLAWYTYNSGAWTRLGEQVVTSDAPIAEGTFDPLPANLIVLAEQ